MRGRPVNLTKRKSGDDRLLRRADWRFLLPSGSPRRIVCFVRGGLAEAAAVIGTTSGPDLTEEGEADLVVIEEGDASTLDAAFRVIRPGGSFYGEWRRFSSGSWMRIRRRLEDAGFVEIACYWPWPPPGGSTPRYWLPLDAQPPLKYFLRSHARGYTKIKALRQRMLGSLWRVAFRARLLRPICVVARRPGGRPSDQGVLGMTHLRWEAFGLGRRPAALSWMLFTPGASARNKLIGLVFADDEDEPRLVVKLPRVPESQTALEREAANLQAVHARRPSEVTGVPSLLFMERTDPMLLGETFISGSPLNVMLNRRSFGELSMKVTRWLSELATGDRATRADWCSRLVERPLTELDREWGPFLTLTELGRLRSRVALLDDLPLVIEQRDCAPWNLSVTDEGRLVVHDWESAEPRGLPLLDLTYFLAYSSFFVDGAMTSGRYVEAYRASHDPATLIGYARAQCERDYLYRLGLKWTVVAPLRALTWLVHLHADCVRVRKRAPSESLFLHLLREELSAIAWRRQG